MPGLVPGIHVLGEAKQAVDGRDKPGHDDVEASEPHPGHQDVPLERSSTIQPYQADIGRSRFVFSPGPHSWL
jgi:hypothetical protein